MKTLANLLNHVGRVAVFALLGTFSVAMAYTYPQAIINVDVTTGPAPLTVQFDGSDSFVDPTALPAMYVWDFGDGNGSMEVSPTHTYSSPGYYPASLFLADSFDGFSIDTVEIVVTAGNYPPTAEPTATPNSGPAPLIVEFVANAVDPDGDALSYLWNFGDPASPDNTSTLADPQHVYETIGTYEVWLTVSDGTNEVYESIAVVVSDEQALWTTRASVIGVNQGTISYLASIGLPVPQPYETIAFSFDGKKLFSAQFSNFKAELDPNIYVIAKRWLTVRIDFTTNTLFVEKSKANLRKFDNSDGVDVELSWGNKTAVDQFMMDQIAADEWEYLR